MNPFVCVMAYLLTAGAGLPTKVEMPDGGRASSADEIVVVGERLKSWSGAIRQTKTSRTCKTLRSTGDQEIDGIACRAMLECFAENRADLHAAINSPRVSRKARTIEANKQVSRCLAARRTLYVAEHVAAD